MVGRDTHVSLGAVVGIAMVMSVSVRAAVISEILTAPASSFPRYIELDVRDRTGPVDLVVIDARPESGRILNIITADTANTDIIVIHDGLWPTPPPPRTALISLTTNLSLASTYGASRRIILFDHPTGWTGAAPPASSWSGILDLISYTIAGWLIEPLPGESPLHLSYGDALIRDHDLATHNYAATYTVGPINSSLCFLNHPTAQLNPGLLNIAHIPGPASALVMILSTMITLRRRAPKHKSPSPP